MAKSRNLRGDKSLEFPIYFLLAFDAATRQFLKLVQIKTQPCGDTAKITFTF